MRASIGLMPTIAVIGTFDTKGAEHRFVADQTIQRGHQALLVDVGGHGEPQIVADIARDEVAEAAGLNLAALRAKNDRGSMVEAMSKAAPVMLAKLVAEGRIQGVISLGGTGGTATGTRGLPSCRAGRRLSVGAERYALTCLRY